MVKIGGKSATDDDLMMHDRAMLMNKSALAMYGLQLIGSITHYPI
jgi:hypothetical protein